MYLHWDGGVGPGLAQVKRRHQTLVIGRVGYKHNVEGVDSIDNRTGAQQEQDHLLETAPLSQEGRRLFIVPHVGAVHVQLGGGKFVWRNRTAAS